MIVLTGVLRRHSGHCYGNLATEIVTGLDIRKNASSSRAVGATYYENARHFALVDWRRRSDIFAPADHSSTQIV